MLRAASLICVLFVLINCGPTGSDIQTYNLGDRVQAGPMVYIAYDTHWYLSLGSSTSPRIPVNRFLVVRMNITNGGAVDCHVPTLMLLDDAGQTVNELTEGTMVPDWMGVARKIKPLEAENGTIAFDAPPKHYKLRVADETDQIVSYIDLPLNFVSVEKSL